MKKRKTFGQSENCFIDAKKHLIQLKQYILDPNEILFDRNEIDPKKIGIF